MQRDPRTVAKGAYDLVIIGGGILGAGIARDATQRGLSVALVEQADFGSGTSSRSTKLIHGGLRYLEQFAFGLVAEACRERSILLKMAPHLVTPLPFLLPAYQGDARSRTILHLGITVYEWLTPRDQDRLPPHRVLSAAETVAEEPCLPREELHGAVLFHDCQMDDARLCLETILDAGRRGAACLNYCRVTGFRREFNRIAAAQVVDVLTGEPFDLRGRLFVNAAGPWIERVARLGPDAPRPLMLSPTKGVHLLLPRLNRRHGIYFQGRSDGRMIFLLPWDDLSLLGTTDTDFNQDPSVARADERDVEYLLEQLHRLAPDAAIGRDDLVTSFAGVRPLLFDPRHPSARPREERMVLQGDNLLSVVGGKYTTFRAIADRVVQRAFRLLGHRAPACRTAATPLVDQRPAPAGEQLSSSPLVHESDLVHACQQELAVTLSDVLRRRTRLALSRHGGPETATKVSHLIATHLRWTEAERERQLAAYLDEWNRARPWAGEPS